MSVSDRGHESMKRGRANGAKTRANKYAPHRRLEPTIASFRSAISNGSALLHDLDHRSAWARRLRDLIDDAVADLGGESMISSAEMILIRRASMLCLQAELMEQRWSDNGGEADAKQIETYQRTTNTLRRTLESLGLKRRPRDVTPSLGELMREQHRRDLAEIDEAEEVT